MPGTERSSERIRVAFSPDIFSLQDYGGISRYFTELIPRVASMDGFEVSVHMGLSPNRYGLQEMRSQFASFRYVYFPFGGNMRYVVALLNEVWFQSYISMRSGHIDAVHITYFPTRMPTTHARLTTTVYDMSPERFPGRVSRTLLSARKRACVARCSRIIAISESTKRDLVEFYNVDPLLVDVTPLANSLHAEPGRDTVRRPYALFVGRRDGYKNFDRFVRVWAEMRSIR